MSGRIKRYTYAKIIIENEKPNTNLIVIQNFVYNVHSFLKEHPGGSEVLLKHKGKDASGPFLSVGHSMDAMELMKKYKVGEIVDSEKKY